MGPLLLAVLLAQVDAGPEPTARPLRHTFWLKKGNELVDHPVAGGPMMELCRKAMGACSFNRAVWSHELIRLSLEADADHRVVRVTSQPTSVFERCVASALEGKRVPRAQTGERMVCSTEGVTRSHFDHLAVARQAARCLGSETPTRELQVRATQVVDGTVVRLDDVHIEGTPRLAKETLVCVRRAVSVPDFEFIEEDRPPFTRREVELVLHAWSPDRPKPVIDVPAMRRRLDGGAAEH